MGLSEAVNILILTLLVAVLVTLHGIRRTLSVHAEVIVAIQEWLNFLEGNTRKP